MSANAASAEKEPLWPVLLTILATVALYAVLPKNLAVGPRWLLPALTVLLLVPAIALHGRGGRRVNAFFGYLLNGLLTFFLLWSLARLVLSLPEHVETAGSLLRSSAALWLTNVLVFALWYWRLDAGGPQGRAEDGGREYAFLFPQHQRGQGDWAPEMVDYLFLAFNASTALSPTDTPVLSPWAKLLMMLQSGISLTVVIVLAARAINDLK